MATVPRCPRCGGNLFPEPERGKVCGWCSREYGAPEPSFITKLLSNVTPEAKQSSGMRLSADTAAILARVKAEMAKAGPPKLGRPPKRMAAGGE